MRLLMSKHLNLPPMIGLHLALLLVASVQCLRNTTLDREHSAETNQHEIDQHEINQHEIDQYEKNQREIDQYEIDKHETNQDEIAKYEPGPEWFSTALHGEGPFVTGGAHAYEMRDDEKVGRQYSGPFFAGKLEPDSLRGFTAEQKKVLVDIHNMYRSNVTPPAADMNFMEYDDELAKLSQTWAEGCIFRHGRPDTLYSKGYYTQNLYWGPQWNGVQALEAWYEEYKDYNVRTEYCVPGEQCGHYELMTNAETTIVGCGSAKCDKKYYHVVCHYFPPFYPRSSIFKIGLPCTQCSSKEGALCLNNACVTAEQCLRNKKACSSAKCQLKCKNCGRLDAKNCRCECADGWDTFDCSRRCLDVDIKCNRKTRGWSNKTCTSAKGNYKIKNVSCRMMCGSCNGLTKESTNVCCGGKLCDDGYTLEDCECVKTCPGLLCDSSFVYAEEEEESSAERQGKGKSDSAAHSDIHLPMKTLLVINLVAFITFYIT